MNTISHTLGAAGMGAQVLYLYGSGAVAIASAVLTFCILVFSEILPKTIGAYFCRSLAIPSAYLIRFLMVIAFPFVWLSNTLSKSISSKEDKVSREEIAAMAEMGEDEGSIDEQESDIIENLFRLKEIQIEDILTPRSVIYAFEDTQTVGKIMDSTEDIIFSRIPVFNDNIDNIIGNWWNAKILETKTQISPLSGSIKKQQVKYIGDEVLEILGRKINANKFSLKSKNQNIAEAKREPPCAQRKT